MSTSMLDLESVQYQYRVWGEQKQGADVVQIMVPVHIFNNESLELAEVCIESIKTNTPEAHNLLIIDNNSEERYKVALREKKGITLVENLTEPLDPTFSPKGPLAFAVRNIKEKLGLRDARSQKENGAYANAVGLELGCAVIDQRSQWVFTMHSDSLALNKGWLSFLQSKTNGKVRAVSCWRDKLRVKALHVGGLLFDYSLFRALDLNFLPNIRNSRTQELPEYDVGDLISLKIQDAGFELYCCQNTYNQPELVRHLPEDHPLRDLHSDRCLNDERQVFFAHLGRGTPKASGEYRKKGKTSAEEWITFAKEHVLSK